MTDVTTLPYRPCVGIMLLNHDNHVFVGERHDYPGAWQMPQGGVDAGEDVEAAFFREMREEIGTDKATILKIMDQPLRYDLPARLQKKLWGGAFRGQEQIWIAARFNGHDTDINLDAHAPAEFKRWQWVARDETINLIVPFKRDTYAQVMQAFADVTVTD